MSSLMIYINIYIIIILSWRSWPASPRAAFDPGRVSGTEAVAVVGVRMCVSGVCVCVVCLHKVSLRVVWIMGHESVRLL